MMLGPAINHTNDTCRMFHVKTRKKTITRDLRWLGKTYGKFYDAKHQLIDVEYISTLGIDPAKLVLDPTDEGAGQFHSNATQSMLSDVTEAPGQVNEPRKALA